jgi:hypothetical protein
MSTVEIESFSVSAKFLIVNTGVGRQGYAHGDTCVTTVNT